MRTTLTAMTLLLATVIIGAVVLSVGLVVPRRWCFDPSFRLWSRLLLAAAGVRLCVSRADCLDSNAACFWIGNHQGSFDIPVLASMARGHLRFLAKESLFRIPLFGWIMQLHGFVAVDRADPRQAKRALEAMHARLRRKPVSVVVFPEGTRSPDGTIGPFKRGVARICRGVEMPVLPFAIQGTRDVLLPGSLRIRAGRVQVSVGKAISPAEVATMTNDELIRRLEHDVSRLFALPDDTHRPHESRQMGVDLAGPESSAHGGQK